MLVWQICLTISQTNLTDCNFIIRMLFYQVYGHYFLLHIYIFVLVISIISVSVADRSDTENNIIGFSELVFDRQLCTV